MHTIRLYSILVTIKSKLLSTKCQHWQPILWPPSGYSHTVAHRPCQLRFSQQKSIFSPPTFPGEKITSQIINKRGSHGSFPRRGFRGTEFCFTWQCYNYCLKSRDNINFFRRRGSKRKGRRCRKRWRIVEASCDPLCLLPPAWARGLLSPSTLTIMSSACHLPSTYQLLLQLHVMLLQNYFNNYDLHVEQVWSRQIKIGQL